MADIGRRVCDGVKKSFALSSASRQHIKLLSVMSFYSLWQHYISMTSQPLANSDRGVMSIVETTE